MDQKKRLNNILLLNSLFYFFGETLNFLPLIINTETKQFFQLEEAVSFSRFRTVVKTGMYIELSRKITVQHKIECILPLYTCPMVVGQTIETGF